MSHIKTFARLKPSEDLYEDYEIKGKKVFSVRVPEFVRDYGVASSKNRPSTISYDFMFDRVFDTSVGQEQVYNITAQEIVTGFLDGYNGTIFAYGQTGTGKTYTVEGSAVRYSDRGLAPRALAQIYKALEVREGEEIAVHISYIEIYQEVAYDLLSTTARTASPVTVFPRVTVVEGPYGTCQIRNLSFHLAPSEEVAHALLLQGQANRKVAETPVNQRSSRSHAVFTIYLSARKPKSDTITRSKLHLVDLAGSERVAKTGVDGQQLTEAKSINLSLHHLETVIIALQGDAGQAQQSFSFTNKGNGSFALPASRPSSADGPRRHVPYRNSLLTMVLRDSLGGNCLTAMIATISLEVLNLGETLSTCRFAQRVACISNHARRNEEIDDKTLIRQLKRRVAELEAQMACLRLSQEGGQEAEEEESSSKLTDEDKIACAHVVKEYLAGRISDPVTAGMTSPFKFRECLRILKRMVMSKYFEARLGPNAPPQPASSTSDRVSTPPQHGPSGDVQGLGQGQGQGQAMVNGEAVTTPTETPSPGERNPAQQASQAPAFSEPPVIDTDELIFNIQKLYTATRREKEERGRQETAQRESRSSSSKSPARGEGYKSPFERKREKEILKLSNKLGGMKKVQETREQHLVALRFNTALGELANMESIIRNKIQVTREQIADQHAYILHLRHTEAGAEIKQREKLVEDQLLKREARFEKKLEEVLQRKADVEAQAATGSEVKAESDGEGEGRVKSGERRSLEEQYSQYKKRNGTLNTRQVFDMLKSEEKKQTKVSKEAELEKKVLMSKQLAQKETLTREKLRELKEMLRRSQEEALLHANFPSHFSCQDNGDSSLVLADSSSAAAEEVGADPKGPNRMNELRKTFVIEEDRGRPNHVEDLENSMTRGDDEQNMKHPGGQWNKGGTSQIVGAGVGNNTESEDSPHQPAGQAQPQEHQRPSHAGSRAELQLEARWERAYSSRPSTAASTRSQEWVTPHERKRTPSGSSSSGNAHSASGSNSPQVGASDWRNLGFASAAGNKDSSDVDVAGSQSDPSNKKLPVTSGSLSEGVPEEPDSVPSASDGSRHTDCEGYTPTVMPSEYVRNMSTRDRFDARKMGLSSKTFESALSSMLNDDSKAVSYSFNYYDKYARSSAKPVPGKSLAQRNLDLRNGGSGPKEHHSQKEGRAQKEVAAQKETLAPKEPQPQDRKLTNAWGPEAKNSPVSLRLAQFLADDGKEKAKPPLPRQTNGMTPKGDPGLIFSGQLALLQEEPACFEEAEVISPRIQAIQDTQRESTYLGRVQAERDRIAKIRRARDAAEAIQRAWRRYSQYSA